MDKTLQELIDTHNALQERLWKGDRWFESRGVDTLIDSSDTIVNKAYVGYTKLLTALQENWEKIEKIVGVAKAHQVNSNKILSLSDFKETPVEEVFTLVDELFA
jgi:hypothetical protein